MNPGDAQIAARLRVAIGRLYRRIRLDSNDVPPLQLSSLWSIERYGPLRLGELAAREAVSAPTMTRVLAALDDRGFILRVVDPTDARSALVSLSEQGRAALAEVRSRRTELLDARLRRLTAQQRESLLAALPALEALVSDEP